MLGSQVTKTLRQWLWDWRAVVVTAPTITLLVMLLRLLGGLQIWEWATYDQYVRLRPPAPPDPRVAIVGIDEDDVKFVGQDPIPDGVLADALNRLKAQNPAAIGLDYYRNLPTEPGHGDLVQVFESTPNLIGIEKVVGESGREVVEGAPTLKALGQLGSNDVIVDGDQRVRRGFISIDVDEDQTAFSFGFYLALLYLDTQNIGIEMLPDGVNWRLGQAQFPPLTANDGGYVRTDAGGHQVLIHYQGGSRYFEVVSLRSLLNGELPDNWATDRVILMGPFSEASKDYFYTPYSASLLSLPQPMYGVEIHAQMISQFIQSAFGTTTPLRSWSEPWEWGWVFGWSVLGATLAWRFRKFQQHPKAWIKPLAQFGLGVGAILVSTYGIFLAGWWVPVVPVVLSYLGAGVIVIGYIAQSAGDIRKTFGRYLSDDIVTTLLDSPQGLKLGGDRRRITILTSDLRGFTALSERLPPEEVIRILNFYLGAMADVITHYRGTIDEFMGDGILVLFGAPTASPDDADRAIACAIAMQQAMHKVNQQMQAWGLNDLEMGIGLNTGDVVVGNIGSLKRTKYGVVGNQVNLTYRIEGYTIGGQILISETTRQSLNLEIDIDSTQQVMPKGVAQSITIYSVVGVGTPYNLHLDQVDDEIKSLQEPLPLSYVIVSGKNVGETFFSGLILELSTRRALVLAHSSDNTEAIVPTPLSNLKLNLVSPDLPADLQEDMYAKVLDIPTNPGAFYISFTAKPPALVKYLTRLYEGADHRTTALASEVAPRSSS